eukprot:Gb_06699 [translate_table: standard]
MTGEGGGKIKKRSREAIKTGLTDVNRGEEDLDLNLSSDIKGLISTLQQIRDKAQKDGQKRIEEIINGAIFVSLLMQLKFLKRRSGFLYLLRVCPYHCAIAPRLKVNNALETN